jgi:hypothetical protein
VFLPRISDTMEEGTTVRWFKAPGDKITAGDELVEIDIDIDKTQMVVEADITSVSSQIVAPEGSTVAVGGSYRHDRGTRSWWPHLSGKSSGRPIIGIQQQPARAPTERHSFAMPLLYLPQRDHAA